MDRLRRLWPAVFLLLLPLIPLWRAVFMGQTIGPFDQIHQMAPWNGPNPSAPWDVLQADGVLQFYPWRDLVLSSWGRLQGPYWNPYQLAGTPLLANSQSAGFYPPHIVLGLLHVPTPLAITLLAWFHLFWAGLGVYLLVRRLGGSEVGGVVGGASFSLGAFMLGWVPLASVVTTVSWIPWCLACVVALFAENRLRILLSAPELPKDPREYVQDWFVADRSKYRTSLALALSVAMMVLSGHLQFVAYGFLAIGVTAIAMLLALPGASEGFDLGPMTVISHRIGGDETKQVHLGRASRLFHPSIGSFVRCLVCIGIGVLLAAPQLLPVLDYSKYSHRRNNPTEEGYAAYIRSSITPQDFLSRLVNPFSQGNPTERADPNVPFSTYWPAIAKPGANWAESAATLGPIVLLLLCLLPFAKVDWRRSSGVLAMTVLALLLGIGTPLNRLLYFFAPGWSSTGSPSRILCLFVLGSCTLAGLALADPLTRTPKKSLAAAFGIFTLILALSLMPTSAPAPQGMNSEGWAGLVAAGNLSFLPTTIGLSILAALSAWAFMAARETWQRYAIVALPVVVAVAAYSNTVRTGDSSFLDSKNDEGFERIAAYNEPWALVAAAPAVLPPNTGTAMRLHDLAGYDSLLHRDTVALLHDIDGKDPAPEANGNIMYIKPSADLKKLAEAGVSELWTRNGRQPITGPGRVSLSKGTARIVDEGTDHIRIETAGSGHLTLRDRMMPGWTATIDGKPATLARSVWREVDVPEGSQTVEMRYLPPGMGTGLWLFLPGLLAVAWFALLSRTRKVRLPQKEETDGDELPKAA